MTGPDSPPRSPVGGGDGDARSGSTGVSPNDGASMHILSTAQILTQPLLSHLRDTNVNETSINSIEAEYPLPVPMAPTATPVKVSHITMISNDEQNEELDSESNSNDSKDMKIKLETLRSIDKNTTLDMDSHMNQHRKNILSSHRSMMVTSDLLRLIPGENEITTKDLLSTDDKNDLLKHQSSDNISPDMRNQANQQNYSTTPKTWSQQDMENALNALRNHNMSLTKASATFGIPSTTLWQRAHRLGIDTPKKEGPSKSWSEGNLHSALQALRTGTISANKASKAYGIPSSTLYKIARREGIRLAAPFNAAPTAWRPGDLERALHSIRSGHSSVQRASTEYGIPTGTLYGRCKREGIELSRSNPTPWSEDAMGEALEAVRVGQMSINQAAIHYNLPYSSLYGRFKRCKYEGDFANIIDSNVQQNQHTESHLTHQMSGHSTLSPHIGNHDQILGHENSRQMYSLYHHHSHSLGIPLELHDHQMESHNGNHSTQDCIPIS